MKLSLADLSIFSPLLLLELVVVVLQPSHASQMAGPDPLFRRHNPVIFVPGDGGSQMEAKLNKTERIHYICYMVSDWYDIWLNIHLLTPVSFDCLSDNMRLYYDPVTKTTKNTAGVQIRPTKFGSIESVDYLDLMRLPKTEYFATIISKLEEINGFVRNKNMLGAPYDFRKAPNELAPFFSNLTALIEDTYILNNYRPVTLICHSMGCLNVFHLLNSLSQAWRGVFVRRIVSLAAPWDGSFMAIDAMLNGDNLGIPLLDSSKLRDLQSTFPSLMYLFPRPPTFSTQQVLVETPLANYSLANLDGLFDEANLPHQRAMWHDTRQLAAHLSPPNVELWCLYGQGVKTGRKLVYKKPLNKGSYEEVTSDGDGTVNLESLQACSRFASQQARPVYLKSFPNTDHIQILRADKPAEFISKHVLSADF